MVFINTAFYKAVKIFLILLKKSVYSWKGALVKGNLKGFSYRGEASGGVKDPFKGKNGALLQSRGTDMDIRERDA